MAGALAGDAQARRDLIARVWPALRPVEPIRLEVEHAQQHEHVLEADAGKLAEMIQILARFEGGDEDEAGEPETESPPQ